MNGTTKGVVHPALNWELLRALGRIPKLGEVRVIDSGVPMTGYYVPDPNLGRRLVIVERGETYAANCFRCNDTRGRLWVNHMYGVYDPEVKRSGSELWKCYNEECQSDPENRRLFSELVFRAKLALNLSGPLCREPAPRKAEPGPLPPCEFPGVLVRLDELPTDHPAVRYVRDVRKFDVGETVATWGKVGYAEHVPARSRESAAAGRVIIPVRAGGVQVGWQARYPGELDWKAAGFPKYLTFFPKSRVLYGLDEAKGAEFLVLVEGVFDVWRYGPGAVCPFGKELSHEQARLLAAAIGDRPLVLTPDYDDPQSEGKFLQSADRLWARGYKGRIGIAPLPPGRDPASLPRAALRRRAETALRDAIGPSALPGEISALG